MGFNIFRHGVQGGGGGGGGGGGETTDSSGERQTLDCKVVGWILTWGGVLCP